jgi:membrane fusion protein (multidrug efflux system)
MSESQNIERNGARKRGLSILGLVVVVAAAAYGAYWFLEARNFATTDDAYVGGDVVSVTARENGTILAIHADSTQSVSRGQLLVDMDPVKARVMMQAAEADLAKTVRMVRAKFSRVDEVQAQMSAARITFAQAQSDLRRRTAAGDSVSQEELIHARDAVVSAETALRVLDSGMTQAQTSVEGTSVATNPDVMASIAQLRSTAIFLGHMQLIAPVSGVIAQRTVQIGQQVAVGAPLMAVVPVDAVWIDANFKEGQLEHMRVGQPVTVKADVYGGDVTYKGKIAGFGAGSGSAFALLPPQNASGNWIKIVQRVPVRIMLEPDELREHPLRLGLSVSVKVDVSNPGGAPLGAPTAAHSVRGDAGSDGGPETEAIIARILSDNGALKSAAH